MNQLESHVILLLEGPLRERGYDLIEVNLGPNQKEGPTLSVVVDRVDPISLSDIVKVSELVSEILDGDDSFEGPYVLDVSSLGAEKPIALEKLSQYVGRYVRLHLSNPYLGENYLEGTLHKADGEEIALEYKDKNRKKTATFPQKDVDKARLAIEF